MIVFLDCVSARQNHALGYIAQWLERLTADQQVPGSNPGVPSYRGHINELPDTAKAPTTADGVM